MIRRSRRRFGKLLTPETGIASGLLAVGIEVAISVGAVRASGWLSGVFSLGRRIRGERTPTQLCREIEAHLKKGGLSGVPRG